MRALAHRHMDCSNSFHSRADALIRYPQSPPAYSFCPKSAETLRSGQYSLGAQVRAFWGHTKALLTECKKSNSTMLTFKVGACATPASGTAMAEYYLSATLKADPAVAAAAYYYAGAEAEQHSTASAHGAARHVTEGGTVALLRRDISPAGR
jgi:hypothetical protein